MSGSPTLLSYVRAQAWQFTLGGLCLLATNAIGLLLPKLLQIGVDRLKLGMGASAVVGIALAIAGLATLQALIRIGSRIAIFFGARQIEYDLRNDLYAHLLRLPPTYYREQRTG